MPVIEEVVGCLIRLIHLEKNNDMHDTTKSTIRIGWGTRVAMLYIGFVVMMITFVVFSMREKVDLVTPDYYEQEMKYQDKLDRVARANSLSTPLTWEMANGNVKLIFPAEFKTADLKGEIIFFRPSDSSKDRKFELQLNDAGEQTISKNDLSPGLYRIQIDWSVNHVTYYKEGTVMIQ